MNVSRMPGEGDRFGNWIIERTLDRGGMGMVYLAYNPDLGMSEKVALKVLDPAIAEKDANFVKRFYQEASIVFKTRCPNLISIHDAGRDTASGFYYIVMEYLGGGTLRDRMRERGRIPWREALAIIRPVALALTAVAKRHSVHRDIKPENIMFTSDGEVKLADFGIAKVAHDDAEVSLNTVANQIFGTPAYMSPDQVMDTSSVDARADIWSLGVVLYEMIAGERPYPAKDFLQAAAFLLSPKPFPDLRRSNPSVNVPEGVSSLLSLMCEKDLDKRISSGEEVIAAIDTLLQIPECGAKRGFGRVFKFIGVGIVMSLVAACAYVFLWPHVDELMRRVRPPSSGWHGVPESESAPEPTNSVPVPVSPTLTNDEQIVTNAIEVTPVPPPVVTQMVDVVASNETPRQVENTDPIRPDPTVWYTEIARIDAEIIEMKNQVERNLAPRLKTFDAEKVALGIESAYEQAAALVSNFMVQAESFTDLASASNAVYAANRDYRLLTDCLDRFQEAREYYIKSRPDREFAVVASNELVALEKTLQDCGAKWRDLKEYKESAEKRERAEREFGRRQYQAAGRTYAAAAKMATNALEKARSGKCQAALESAKVHLDNQNWAKAERKADEAMRWQPDNKEARNVKREARQHLYATLKLVATVDGRVVKGAKIVEGGFALNEALPWSSDEMKKGEVLEPFVIEYSTGERKWRGAFKGITVDWTGTKNVRCPLVECARKGCRFVPADQEDDAEYLVIDLSSGPASGKYPVSYLKTAPKEWSEEYKSSKLVLRRIQPGSFKHHGKASKYAVSITRRYYIGVFEVTHPQWMLVMGGNPGCVEIGDAGSGIHYRKGNVACRVTFAEIRGENLCESWPESDDVDDTSFLGRLRKRTGISTLDLPTEGQWEQACRAGTETEFHTGNGPKALALAGWYRANAVPWSLFGSNGPTLHEVGMLQPNGFGLYDMHGNAEEWCLDHVSMALSYAQLSGTDPIGACPGDDGYLSCAHMIRGGSFSTYEPGACSSSARSQGLSKSYFAGFRIVAN